MPVIRSTTLTGFADLVRGLGGDPEHLARTVGLPVRALTDSDMTVPMKARAEAFELAAERLSCPDFGLRMARYADISGLGPLAVALRHSATLGEAFGWARRFLSLHHEGSTLGLVEDPYDVAGVVGVQHVWRHSGTRYPQATDAALVGLHTVITTLVGGTYGLRSVELGYRPAAAPLAYRAAFGDVRVNVDQPSTMLRLPRQLLDHAITDAEETLRDIALSWLDQQEAPADLTLTLRARSVIESTLATGQLSAPGVADALGMPLRSLQRALAAEGTSVASLVDETRRDRVLRLLAQPQVPLSAIPAMIGLVDQTTLARLTRRWWGQTPRSQRRTLLGQP